MENRMHLYSASHITGQGVSLTHHLVLGFILSFLYVEPRGAGDRTTEPKPQPS